MKVLTDIGVALIFGAAVCGCGAVVAAGGAAGSVLYLQGDLESTIDNGYDDVYRACQLAIQDLGLEITEQGKGTEKAFVKSRRLDGKPIKIVITPITKYTTEVSIRVGTFGDESSSLEILDAIKRRL